MGRMLEYLVRNKQQSPLTDDADPPTDCDVEPKNDDDCPYIEVGDPEKKLVGSPSVVSSPHPGHLGVQPPHSHQPQPPAMEKPEATADAPSIHFERWVRPSAESCPIAPEIVAYHHPADAVSRQYCQLLDQVWRDKNHHTALLFRGIESDFATATVMLNVAVSCCFHHHRRVVVVGGDFGQPEIRRLLGIKQEAGLSDVIVGETSLKDVVQKTAVPHLYAIHEGETDEYVDVTQAASWMLNWLRQRFDLTLIVAPSMEQADGAAPWMTHTDGVLLVGQPSSSGSDLTRMSEAIDRAGGTLQGFVHTNVRV